MALEPADMDVLRAAVIDCARPEVERIGLAVIEGFRKRSAHSALGNPAARHLWDEYCWTLQNGPFDDDVCWDSVSLGSASSAVEDMALAAALSELEKLPRHLLIALSALAFEVDPDFPEESAATAVGTIWPEGIAKLVLERIDSVASRRCLDFIGPDRTECMRYEISGSGVVWEFLRDRGEAWEITADYLDELVDPEADLQPLADALLHAYLEAAKSDTDDSPLGSFFTEYEAEVRGILVGGVLGSVEEMRKEAVSSLDG